MKNPLVCILSPELDRCFCSNICLLYDWKILQPLITNLGPQTQLILLSELIYNKSLMA